MMRAELQMPIKSLVFRSASDVFGRAARLIGLLIMCSPSSLGSVPFAAPACGRGLEGRPVYDCVAGFSRHEESKRFAIELFSGATLENWSTANAALAAIVRGECGDMRGRREGISSEPCASRE